MTLFHKIREIHLVGIGGSGMNGIAEVLLNRGFGVSGSDLQQNAATKRLASLGAKIFLGHQAEHVGHAQVVVTSSAIRADNPEVLCAKELGIPVIPRAEMLMELMRTKFGVAVAGAHGKTTTTSLILSVLGAGNLDPTAVIGGKLNSIGSHVKLGQGDLFIAEADESDGSFLRLTPTLSVITNIDREHMDHYGSMENVRHAFIEFANRVPFYGATIVCSDDPEVRGIIPSLNRRVLTYGLNEPADLGGRVLSREGMTSQFVVLRGEKKLGEIRLHVPGIHNVRNALAAVCIGLECGVSFSNIARGLEEFQGIERRFQRKGEAKGIFILDDYAHHPREIEATLSACREAFPKRRLLVVFQPHRFSRLRDLFHEFAACFSQADVLLLLPIYAAGEKPIEGMTSEQLTLAIQNHGHRRAQFVESQGQALTVLKEVLQEGDLLVTLGAGDVWRLAEEVNGALR